MAEQPFDPNGSDLPLESVRQARNLQRGDLVIFSTKTWVLQVKRLKHPDGVNLRTIHTAFLPIIAEKQTFRNVVQHMCDIARIPEFQEDTSVPKPYWAFRLG